MKHALRICNEPGCPQIAGDDGRCAAHQAAHERIARDQRPTPAEQGYDRAWQQRRAAFLKRYRVCAECGAPATDVDHVIPKAQGGTDDLANLQPLCHVCHSRKTARETGGWRKASNHGIMT